MSGLAAAVRVDGGPPPLRELELMIAAAPHRRPDGCTTWSGVGAALAKLHRLSLPEQSTSVQPAVDAAGRVAVFDGRIDNRRDIAARLADAALGDEDDVRYLTAAIARLGDAAAAALEGDFAFAVWDPASRTLSAARDAMGMRPLYWTVDAGLLLVASDIAQVLAAMRRPPAPDAATVVDVLRSEPPTDGRTLYEGVRRLLPGERLDVSPRGTTTVRYWRAEAAPPDRGRRDDDYAEECRALLDRAVAARLRARTPVALFFSGGIDSSTVLSAALRVGGAGVVPLSIDYRDAESEERRYRDAFAAFHGVSTVELAPAPIDVDVWVSQAARRRLPPDLPSQFIGRVMRAEARARGARAVLTGEGGDALFSGTTYQYADLLRRGRVFAALAQYARDARGDDSGWTRAGLITDGVWPLLPRGWRERLRGPASRLRGAPPAWRWVRGHGTPRPAVPDPPRGVPISTWAVAWEFNRGWTSYYFDMFERDAAEWGLEPRHPLVDRRLVEFALRLPEPQRRRGVTNKIVLRRAADLPAPLAARTTKASLGHSMTAALAALGGRGFFAHLRLAEAGWVDAAEAVHGYDYLVRAAIPGDPLAEALLPRLWTLAALEIWMRGGLRVEGQQAAGAGAAVAP
jgi:asparagine synthase (glutamine-hydrolysing)